MSRASDFRGLAEQWLREALEGGRALEALGRFIEALDREATASSIGARAAAQADALKAQQAFDAASGVTKLRQRRMAASAQDLPVGGKTDAADLGRITGKDELKTRAGRVAARLALARHVLDTSDATVPLGGLLTAHLRGAGAGHDGLFMEREPRQGSARDGDPAEQLKETVITSAGYTCGVELSGDRVPHSIWVRAAEAHALLAHGLAMRGHNVRPLTAQTIKQLAQGAGPMKALFVEAWEQGRADHKAGIVNQNGDLPTLDALPRRFGEGR